MKVIIYVLAILFSSVLASAQQPTPSPTAPVVGHRSGIRRIVKRPGVSKPPTTIGAATSARVSSDFFVGAAKVDVTKDETVIRLAMAQHGSVLIELPANDGPRFIIPGDPEMATVDQKALERNKRAIVVRPGAGFVPPPRNRPVQSPAATVTAQMRSGLVVTFLFYPVEDLSQNVHRCVLNYNRDEVVARRRSAGLPVNLDTNDERGGTAAQNTAALSSVSLQNEEPKTKPTVTGSSPTTSAIPSNENRTNAEAETYSRTALAEAVKQPKRFKKWTKEVHGLSLSVVSRNEHAKGFNVAIVGIKNTTSETLKLVPGTPELFIETMDDKGKSINLQSIKKAHVEASDISGSIAPGTIAYYAVAYVSPILGAHQQLRISLAQTDAADEPASLTIAKH